MKPFLRFSHYTLLIIVVSLWMVALYLHQEGDGLGTDFYPIYRAGQALLAGENPYGPEMIEHFEEVWKVPFAAAGFAYPIPAVVGVLPIVFLPLTLAVIVWTLFGTLGSFLAIRLRSNWPHLLLLPFLFMPLHRAIVVKQATLIWFAFIVILIFAMRRKWSWVAGWCIVLLPAKPQTGLFFALAGLIWAWKHDRSTLAWVGGWGVLVWGGSFLLQPSWVSNWIASIRLYDSIVYTASLLPWGLLLMVFVRKLPWYAQLGALQTVLFPLSDVYGGLPLLLTWVGIGGPLALIGSSVSWLGFVGGLPNTMAVFWASVMAPITICAAWHTFEQWRSQRFVTAQTVQEL